MGKVGVYGQTMENYGENLWKTNGKSMGTLETHVPNHLGIVGSGVSGCVVVAEARVQWKESGLWRYEDLD